MSEAETKRTEDLITGVFGQSDPSFAAVAELDPAIAKQFALLGEASAKRGALEPKVRALISLSLNASVTHLKEKHTRIHMADAIRHGATKEEICEVLELTSVLGIHGFIPGVQILLNRLGGLDAVKRNASPEARERAEAAKAQFIKARGNMGDVWEANCYLAPDFVTAYAGYSGVPWATKALDPKIKEFIYVAIDLSPTHGDVGGATFHLNTAIDRYGATLDEVLEVLEIIGLMGFQTHMLALPILKEELAKAGKA